MKRARKLTSVLLSALLICALLPTLAFADSEVPTTPPSDDVLNATIEQTDGSTSLDGGEGDASSDVSIQNTQDPQTTDGLDLSVQSTENALAATGFAAALDTTSTADTTIVEPLANGDFIDVNIEEIDGIAHMDFLNIVLRVLTGSQDTIGLYVYVGGGSGTDYQRITIDNGTPVATIDNTGETVKTYRFIGDGSPGSGKTYPKGIQLSINGEYIDRTIAIECGNELTGLTLDSSAIVDSSIAKSAASSAIGLSNGAHVQMTLNNNVSLASRAGYAGINVPSYCQLDVFGSAAATTTPTLTATAGTGAAGIGGDAGYTNDSRGQSSGKINLFSHLIVKATGGDAVDGARSGGAGIGGGGADISQLGDIDGRGGNASLISVTGNVVLTAQGKGNSAGIGGGGGGSVDNQYGGNAEGFKAYADESGGPTIMATSTGSGSGIGGGAGNIDSTRSVSGMGGKIELGNNSSGVTTPLFVTATSIGGNDLGAIPGAIPSDEDPDTIVIGGGSIVANSFGVSPTDGTNPVYPVVIPKSSDITPATTLTGHLDFEVPISDGTTYHVATVDSDDPEHANFGYAAQLWLPVGFIGGINGATSDKSVSIDRGHVDVKANLKPIFASGENVVSFKDVLYKLTLNYNLSGSGLSAETIEVAGGSVYTLSAEPKIHATWRLTGWSDGTAQYQLGASFTMPWNDSTLTGVWTDVLIPGKTDDLSAITGDKDIRVGLNVELSELKEVGYANANGTNYKALTKDKEYGLISGSTIVVLKASWLSTLTPGNYLLRVTYTDYYYELPFTTVAPSSKVIPKTADSTGIMLLNGAIFLAFGTLCLTVAARQRKREYLK